MVIEPIKSAMHPAAICISGLSANLVYPETHNMSYASFESRKMCIRDSCDEIHAFKQPKQYNLFKEAMKAYTNKLLIGISTAGDNEQAFLGQRLKYCRKILNGTVKDEQYFIFMCCAPEGVKDGSVDYTDPKIHEMANPAYGVSIRPDEILNDSLQDVYKRQV